MRIFYDGDCVFCKNYVAYAKLRSVVDCVELISLRSDHPAISEIISRSFKINRGFVVEHDGLYYEGAAAFSYLNLVMADKGFVPKFAKLVSSHKLISAIVYQLLVIGRYLTLGIQGLCLIDLNASTTEKSRFPIAIRLTRVAMLAAAFLIFVSIILRIKKGDFLAAGYSACCLVSVAILYWYSIRDNVMINKYFSQLCITHWPTLIFSLVAYVLLINSGYPLVSRRFIGFLLAVPIVCILLHYGWRLRKLTPKFGIIPLLPVLGLLFAIVPGVAIGPFYGGIAGWVIRASKTDVISIRGYQLVNDTGKTHWLSHAFLQPHGHIGRFQWAYLSMPDKTQEDYVSFLFKTYKRNFYLIEKGRFPHQWALGSLAYPTHSLGKYDTEILKNEFPPQRVKQILFKEEQYTIDGVLLSIDVKGVFNVSSLPVN